MAISRREKRDLGADVAAGERSGMQAIAEQEIGGGNWGQCNLPNYSNDPVRGTILNY
jgi:hypothetical protein